MRRPSAANGKTKSRWRLANLRRLVGARRCGRKYARAFELHNDVVEALFFGRGKHVVASVAHAIDEPPRLLKLHRRLPRVQLRAHGMRSRPLGDYRSLCGCRVWPRGHRPAKYRHPHETLDRRDSQALADKISLKADTAILNCVESWDFHRA